MVEPRAASATALVVLAFKRIRPRSVTDENCGTFSKVIDRAMVKKRKTFLVEKQVQGALGWRIAAHWFIFLGLSIFVTCSLQMLGSFDRGSLWSSLEKALLGQVGSVAVLLALLPWFIHDSLKLSNRFAGPMVRLRGSIIALTTQEETRPVSFRSGDFWQEIADDFNQLRLRTLAERGLLAQQGLSVTGNVVGAGARLKSGNATQENAAVLAAAKGTLPLAVAAGLPSGGQPAVATSSSVS